MQAADTAACAAVSGGALSGNTACDAVMLAADGATAACTYTSVAADATTCGAVDLSAATARADCGAINTAADAVISACLYTPAAFTATCTDWRAGDAAATGCRLVDPGYYDHDKLSYTAPLQCAAGNMVSFTVFSLFFTVFALIFTVFQVGECIEAQCRDSGGGLVVLVTVAEEQCLAVSGTNTFDPNAITLCANTLFYAATMCTPVPPGTYDDDGVTTTEPVSCSQGSTTDTLDQPGAATCVAVPPGFFDDDAVIDGAPFCSDSSGAFITADVAATRPTAIYCEVSASGGVVSIVNPTFTDVSMGEVRMASAAGLSNPTGAFTGPYAQQALQTPAFPLHTEAGYTQYLDFNFYETANLFKMTGDPSASPASSQTFAPGTSSTVGPIASAANDLVCEYTAPDACVAHGAADTSNPGTAGADCTDDAACTFDAGAAACAATTPASLVVTMLTFIVTATEVACVGVAGNTWSRHTTFQSSTTAPAMCLPGSTTDTQHLVGATSCTEAPTGEFDHDSACHAITGYCKDSYNSCVDVDVEEYCAGSFAWRADANTGLHTSTTNWCMLSDGTAAAALGDLSFDASLAACETVPTCAGTVTAPSSPVRTHAIPTTKPDLQG